MIAVPGTREHDACYARVVARDAGSNGRQFTAVRTTKIVCLPSCGARVPKPENVEFYPSLDGALEAGFRPCKRCKPERLQFFDEETALAAAVNQVRHDADRIRTVEEFARVLDWSPSKLNNACHRHYHSTAGNLIIRSRMEWACRQLLESSRDVTEIGLSAGYDSLSGFYSQFKKWTGLAPGDYRKLSTLESLELELPRGFEAQRWLKYWDRRSLGVSERLEGGTFEWAFGNGVYARAEVSGEAVRLESKDLRTAQQHLTRMLGFGQDLDGFEASLRSDPADSKLLPNGCALRIPQTTSVWSALVWSIVGQQVTVQFAGTLRARLTELLGQRSDRGLIAEPTPSVVAKTKVEDLRDLQFSERKAAYLIDIADRVVRGELPLDEMPSWPAGRVERTLLDLPGIGPWAANYVMMRGCGLMDCVPLGDTGLTMALSKHLGVTRPDADATKQLMERYAPYRSLATFHLWNSVSGAEA